MRILCHVFEQSCEKEITLLYYLGKILLYLFLSEYFGAHTGAFLGLPCIQTLETTPDPFSKDLVISVDPTDTALFVHATSSSAISRAAFL